jgi:hypothetical protein
MPSTIFAHDLVQRRRGPRIRTIFFLRLFELSKPPQCEYRGRILALKLEPVAESRSSIPPGLQKDVSVTRMALQKRRPSCLSMARGLRLPLGDLSVCLAMSGLGH